MNLNQTFIALLFLCGTFKLSAQVAEVRTYGGPFYDVGRQVIETDDGYLIVGTTASADDGNTDIYLLSLNDDLTVRWSKTLGGLAAEQGRSACVASNGDLLVLGQTASGEFGGYDLVIYRLSPEGDVLWEKYYGTNDWDLAARIVAGDDYYYIAATSFGFSPGDSRQWLFRIGDDGEVINGNTFDILPRAEANDLKWYDGHLYMIGTRTFEGGHSQGVLRKLQPNGAIVWEYFRDTTEFVGMAVDVNNFGVAAAFGVTNVLSENNWDMYLSLLDTDGNELYVNHSSPPGVNNQIPRGVVWVNNITIQASYTDDYGLGGLGCFLNRVNFQGFFMSSTVFGGELDEEPYSIMVDSQGRVLFIGYSNSYGNDYPDVYLVRLPDEVITNNYELDIVSLVSTDPFTSVEEFGETDRLYAYPNPAVRQLYLPETAEEWTLFDLSGRLVKTGSERIIDVQPFERGAYLLRWRSGEKVFNDRIVFE